MDSSAAAAPAAPQTWPDDMLVLIPVYNHAATVGVVAAAILAAGAPVLVVDDGSTDGSGEAARQSGADVLTLSCNQGKAAALRHGMEEAYRRGYRRVLSCDADGQHPPSEVLVLAAEARDEPAAVFIGCRRMAGAPFISRLGRFLCNTWSWLACGRWMGDSQSGLRVYPLPSTLQLPTPAVRYAYEVEVLIRAAWADIAIRRVSVAVIYPEDRVSHFDKLRDNLRAGLVLSRLCLRRLWPVPSKLLPVPGVERSDERGL